MTRKAEAQLEHDLYRQSLRDAEKIDGAISEYENVVRYCASCDEEYQLPEDMEKCPICEKPLQEEE